MPIFVSKFRRFLILKDSIAEHFYKYKKLYLLFGILILSALIIGVMAGIKKAQTLDVQGLPDATLLNYLGGKLTIGGVFASRLFTTLGLLIFVWLLCFNIYTGLLNILILVYNAFLLGATCAMLISLFKFAGFINILLVYLPCRLVHLYCLLVLSVVSIKFSFDRCNTASVLSLEYFYNIKAILLIVFVALVISCIFELLLLPWLSSALVVGLN